MDILYKTSQCSEWDFPEGKGDFQAKSLHEGTVDIRYMYNNTVFSAGLPNGEGISKQNPSALRKCGNSV